MPIASHRNWQCSNLVTHYLLTCHDQLVDFVSSNMLQIIAGQKQCSSIKIDSATLMSSRLSYLGFSSSVLQGLRQHLYPFVVLTPVVSISYHFAVVSTKVPPKRHAIRPNYLLIQQACNPVFQRRRFEFSFSLRACNNHNGQEKSRSETDG